MQQKEDSFKVRDMAQTEDPPFYRIVVHGILESTWSVWFDGFSMAYPTPDTTSLTGPVKDQSALHGLLAKIRDLGLPLVSVQRID